MSARPTQQMLNRFMTPLLILLVALTLVACGGGGGGATKSTTTATTSTPVVSPGTASPMGCGTVTTLGSGNQTPIVVDGFPCTAAGAYGYLNYPQTPYVSVKICAAGSTSNCQIIDHVILDTGSTGLRVAAAALSSTLQPGNGLSLASGSVLNSTLVECEQYVDSYAYGPVVNVDVYIAGQSVLNTTMQVFGVGGGKYPVPSACSSNGGTETDTIATFGGNGLLGVSFGAYDGGPFFDCNNSNLSNCTADNTFNGLPNPVEQLAVNNNGVVVTLPAVPATGATTPVTGTLTLGINTQSNNTVPSATIAVTNDGNYYNSTFGTFAVQIGGTWTNAYIDSGTGFNFFNDAANAGLVACASTSNWQGFYCPTTAQTVPISYANFQSTTPVAIVNFSVVPPASTSSTAFAYSNIAGPVSTSSNAGSDVALGLTSFFGYANYILFQGFTAPGNGLGGTSLTTVQGPINGIYLTPN